MSERIRIACVLTGLLVVPLLSQERKGDDMEAKAPTWEIPIRTAVFSAQPDEISPAQKPQSILVVDGPQAAPPRPRAPSWSVRQNRKGVSFEVIGQIGAMRAMNWSTPLAGTDPGRYSYYVLRYRVRGIARSYQPFGAVSVEGEREGKAASVILLDAAEARNDNRWHTVVGKLSVPTICRELRVRLTTLDSLVSLELGELTLHAARPTTKPELAPPIRRAKQPVGPFERIGLQAQFNDTCAAAADRVFKRQGMIIDGGVLPAGQEIRAGMVPFQIGAAQANLIRPAEDASVNQAPAEFAGVKTTREFQRPIGRDDPVVVPIGRRTSEVFLLLVAELPKSTASYANPPQPVIIEDVGALVAELHYAEGESDLAFPYSLLDEGFTAHRMCAAYALAADPTRELRQVSLHNRMFGSTFSIAAATVNTGSERVIPKLAAEPESIRPPVAETPPPRVPFVRRDGQRITLGNRFYEIALNCESGLSVERLVNRWSSAAFAVSPTSGLELLLGDTAFTGRAFTTTEITIADTTATITMVGGRPELPLELTATFATDTSPQLQVRLAARNTGNAPLQATVSFPMIRSLTIADWDDTWLFFPQYRTVITNQLGTYSSHNDLKFPTQVFDAYNPRVGAGLAVLTRNQNNATLDYHAAKQADGATLGIRYPADFYTLQPGETVHFTDTRLLFHAGDWHQAMQAYRDWLATWYRPVKAAGRDWFQRVFALRCHQTKKFYSWGIPIYDADTGKYRADEFVAGDTEYLGLKPQMMHIFGWTDLDKGWRGHPNSDYDPKGIAGGAQELRRAVRRLQEDLRIPTSLYTLSDRCLKESVVGKKLGEIIARRRADGSRVEDEANWFVCPSSAEWHEHYAQGLKRAQAATGVKVLYVDVFGYPRGSACYATDHGHPVPSNTNEGCRLLLKRLREVLPKDVALWSEYPVNDTAFQYLDGNIHYYCLYWHTYFSKHYDHAAAAPATAPVALNICRYAFPDVKQFVFLCGVNNWASDAKFPFFNGEALYDTSWFLYASPHLDRMRKSLAIQTEYADCFAAAQAEPRVPTDRAHVHANRFPGEGRTLWTMYNARYATVRGAVLTIPHQAGATYHDVWNDRPLVPKTSNGRATLSLTLGPQGLGCIVQTP